jgi:diguanylate cyclase (GGDEF)-like protein
LDDEPVVSRRHPKVPDVAVHRAVAVARLAANEGNTHTLRDQNLIVAAGESGWGVAVARLTPPPAESVIASLTSDLQRAVADLAVRRPSGAHLAMEIRSGEGYSPALDTLPSLAFKLCERARTIANLGTAVVLYDAGEGGAAVISVSYGADRRLLGRPVPPEAAAARACRGDTPLVADDMVELLGGTQADRRRGGGGAAYPLRDGRVGFGSLVLFGRPSELGRDVWEQVMWLAADIGPQLAAAAAVQAAEDRALRDPMTGLPNRTALDRAIGSAPAGPNSVLCVDLDHFKRLNDTHGHAAGDAALRHVAGLFRRALREGDLPARVGGEEFAFWLAGADAPTSLEVAERVRAAIEEGPFEWAGRRVPLTCSIGVASTDSADAVLNLVTAADAALYRAKRGGRNRVEVASGVGRIREPAAEASR